MALRVQLFRSNLVKNIIIRSIADGPNRGSSTPAPSAAAPKQGIKDVPGLSARIIKKTPNAPWAKADGEYKVPEYYSFNNTSYYEAEIEMAEFRCPQPSALK